MPVASRRARVFLTRGGDLAGDPMGGARVISFGNAGVMAAHGGVRVFVDAFVSGLPGFVPPAQGSSVRPNGKHITAWGEVRSD